MVLVELGKSVDWNYRNGFGGSLRDCASTGCINEL